MTLFETLSKSWFFFSFLFFFLFSFFFFFFFSTFCSLLMNDGLPRKVRQTDGENDGVVEDGEEHLAEDDELGPPESGGDVSIADGGHGGGGKVDEGDEDADEVEVGLLGVDAVALDDAVEGGGVGAEEQRVDAREEEDGGEVRLHQEPARHGPVGHLLDQFGADHHRQQQMHQLEQDHDAQPDVHVQVPRGAPVGVNHPDQVQHDHVQRLPDERDKQQVVGQPR